MESTRTAAVGATALAMYIMAMVLVGTMSGGVMDVRGVCPPPPPARSTTTPPAGSTTVAAPPPPATSSTSTTCSVNLVKLSVCSPLLSGGTSSSCCALLGLLGVDLEVCLCLALDINVLGLITVDVPKLDVVASILTSCGYTVPPNLSCP